MLFRHLCSGFTPLLHEVVTLAGNEYDSARINKAKFFWARVDVGYLCPAIESLVRLILREGVKMIYRLFRS